MTKGFFRAALALIAGFGLGIALIALAGPAGAQVFQPNLDCDAIHLSCQMQADEMTPGDDPCSAYARCQARQMCEQGRCICHRSGSSADPALIEEATAMCNLVVSPHGPNSCDRYAKGCQAWVNAQHPKPETPHNPPPQQPAQPQPGMPAQPLPPDQSPRFR